MSHPKRNDGQHNTVHAGLPPRANRRPPPAPAVPKAVTDTTTQHGHADADRPGQPHVHHRDGAVPGRPEITGASGRTAGMT